MTHIKRAPKNLDLKQMSYIRRAAPKNLDLKKILSFIRRCPKKSGSRDDVTKTYIYILIQASSVFRVDIVAAVLLPIVDLPLALVLMPRQTSSIVQAFCLLLASVVIVCNKGEKDSWISDRV